MENIYFITILIIGIIFICYIHLTAPNPQIISNTNSELFNSNNIENQIMDISMNTDTNIGITSERFMIRDLRTKLWLLKGQEGFSKFLPGRFGNVFVMSENYSNYLPLRLDENPNIYLLSTIKGDGIIRMNMIKTPNKYYVIQVSIHNGYNILGYLLENDVEVFLYVGDNGDISTVSNPDHASIIEIIKV